MIMPPSDQKMFFESIQDIQKTIGARFDHVVDKLDAVKSDVASLSRELGEVNTMTKLNNDVLIRHADEIDDLNKRDRGVMAIATALGGAIGVAVSWALMVITGRLGARAAGTGLKDRSRAPGRPADGRD